MSQGKHFKIVLTGGGTAGHVMPHLALIPEMRQRSWNVAYIGTKKIEKTLVSEAAVPFYTIQAGKLRRYFSFQNLLDVFRCFIGFIQSLYYLLRLKPDLVFSKGGYVSVPVCLAAWVLGIPVLTHESDVTPGLANRIIAKVAKKVFYSFPQSKKHLPEGALYTPLPVRDEIFRGSREEALRLCGFEANDKRPVVLIMGGSQGAQAINQAVVRASGEFFKFFRVIHLTGAGKSVALESSSSYYQQEYAKNELKDFFALADLVVSRSGANSIFEFLALHKPMILIPLVAGSRGDQVVNARAFEEKKLALVQFEKDLTPENFLLLCKKALTTLETSSEETPSKEALNNRNALLDSLEALSIKIPR